MARNFGNDTLFPGRGLADRIVEGEGSIENAAADLPAIRHLAERRRIQRRRHCRVDGFDRSEDRDFGRLHADHMREIDGVADDVGLFLEGGGDVDSGIGNDERCRPARHVHDIGMADPSFGAKACSGRDYRAHQFIRVQ